jgi:hypothetical protein
MPMRSWPLVAFANALLSSAWAQAPATQQTPEEKYRDYTPQQIAELPEAVRLNEVPIRYIFAAQGYEDPAGFELVHSMKLQALMYPAAVSFKQAVIEFQRDLEEPPTGTLTVSQIAELTYRNGIVKLGRAELPNTVRAVTIYDQYATAQGTWAGVDEALPWPINQVQIECDQQLASCEESTTSVVVPGHESWEMNYLILTSTDRYDVTRWRNQQIDATRLLNCRHIDLTIRRDGEVTRAPGEPASIAENCAANLIPGDTAAELPDAVRLIDGGDVIRNQYRALRRLALSLMSSAFQAKLAAWRASASPAEETPPEERAE